MKKLNLLTRLRLSKGTVVRALPVDSGREVGMVAGLPPGFEWRVYVAAHDDLSAFTRAAAEQHYLKHGAAEGRLFNSEGISRFIGQFEAEYGVLPEMFNWQEYVANYADLSFIKSSYQAARHFLVFGRKEGRVPFRFEADVYRSLYFLDARISDDALMEHFQTIGRPSGALATLEQIAKHEGLKEGFWLHYLNLDEFNLLNSRWAGVVANKQQALQAMIREGFDRISPISFSHEFDPKYYADANPAQASKSEVERYKQWLFEGIKVGVPGSAAEHLKRHGLKLLEYPEGFDWKSYARLPGVGGDSRWDLLYHVLVSDDVPPSRIPLHEVGSSRFLTALASAILKRNPGRAAELFALASRQQALSPSEREQWGDCLAKQEQWDHALDHYRQAIEAGAVQVPTAVKAVGAALEVKDSDEAIRLLRQTMTASGGDIRWRAALRKTIDAAFRAAWTTAEELYAKGKRLEADATMGRIVADIESWWTIFDPPGPPIPPAPGNRIIMLANVDLRQCTQYRVTQKMEIANAAGIDLEVYTQANVDEFIAALPGASAALFYRLPALPMNIRAISVCRALGIPSYYDIDDLIFDADHYPEPIETYGASVSKSFYHSLQTGVPLFRAAMALCDYGIASTTLLASYMEEVVRSGRCFVLPNGIDSHHADYFSLPTPKVRQNDEIVLFYGSGTKAHNSDFLDLMGGPLLDLMSRYPNLRLMVVGFLSLDSQFDSVRDRITQLGWTKDIQSYWSLLAEADINMAVLIPSPITDCKSEIKWLEAAALGLPSVVSATHRYEEVLEDGVDVCMARTSDEWLRSLEALIESPDRRRAVAQAARAKAQRLYALEINAERLKAIFAPAFEQADSKLQLLLPKRKKRILFFNIFFPPQTIGGSTRVARDNIDSFLASDFAAECDFAVMTSDNDNPVPYQLKIENYKGIPVFRANSPIEDIQEWRPFNERYGQLFRRVLEIWQPDLVHIHSIQRGSASLLTACIHAGIPYINTIHDAWWVSDYHFLTEPSGASARPEEPLPTNPPHGKSIGRSLERRRRLRILLERSAAILGVSDAFTKLMHEAGYPATQSVPNGIPHVDRVTKTRSSSGRVRIVQVGGQTHHKGYHLIQAAFKQGNFPNLELTVIDHQRYGGPTLETRWGHSVVRFMGKTKQEEMHTLYANQDVLLAPSVWPESFGLVSREATALGLWVVASDRGAIGEGIEHGVNGWIVDVSTLEPFLSTLEEINNNPSRYLDPPPILPLEARTAEDQARDLIAIYRDILGRPHEQQPLPYFMTGGFVEDEDMSQEDRAWLLGKRDTFSIDGEVVKASNQKGVAARAGIRRIG